MTSYPTNDTMTHLSRKHEHMLLHESGIDPGIAAERGYHTARRRSEVPETFKDYQRKPGLVLPTFSPDGITKSCQLKPDTPRKDKKGKALKYETPGGSEVIADVHPRMLEEVRSGNEDLWITEGCKKGDALTSRGLPTISLAGVWMWSVPKVKPYRLKPCFDHVKLRGRRVCVVFDSDALAKEGVQLALGALVAALERRGAEVLVVYLEDAPDGSKVGVDDYLAGGGTVNELKMLARKFEPADVGRIRLSRDEKLRAGVEDLKRRHAATRWTWPGADADEDVYLKIIEKAERCGKVVGDGLRVVQAQGPLGLEAKISSRTTWKSLNRLEERGFLYRDNENRKADKAGAFVLRASVSQYGERVATEGKETRLLQESVPGDLHPRAPRLWASRPKWKPTKKMIREHRLGVRTWMPEPREGLKRLGKKRGHCVDRLDVAGGTLTLEELGEQMGIRPRDLVRRKTTEKGRDGLLIWLQEAGIVAMDSDSASLTPDWLDRLEEQREIGEEIEAEEVARRRYRDKSRAYHNRNKAPESKPSAAGLEALKRGEEKRAEHIAAHEEHQAKAHIADLEAKRFAKRFVHDRVRELGRIRLGLLQQILRDAGGAPAYALPAAKSLGCTVEKLSEFGEFVFAPSSPHSQGAA